LQKREGIFAKINVLKLEYRKSLFMNPWYLLKVVKEPHW